MLFTKSDFFLMVSGTSLFFGLFNNLAIFIALVAIYGTLIGHFEKSNQYKQQIALGFSFGLFAIGCMYAKIPVAEGAIVDQRNAIVALSGAFGGPLSAVLSAAMAGAFRVYLGGGGAFAGVVGVCLAAVAGIGLNKFSGLFDSVRNTAAGALVATVIILPGFLFVGDLETGWELTKAMALPYGTAIFLGISMVGLLLAREDRRRRAEVGRKISEERFRDFAMSASDWFWEMDADLRFSYFSDRAFEIMKADRRGVIGKTRKELATTAQFDADPEKWRAHFDDLEAHRPFRGFRYTFLGDDGVERHLTTNGIPVFDENGTFNGYRGTGTDITELMRAEEGMREAMEHATLANRAKTEFLANMSHELRTPLNSIIGFSEMLEGEIFGPLGSDKNREYVGDVKDSGAHLLRIIEDILDVSRIEAGVVSLEREALDVGDTIGSCMTMMRARASEAEVALSSEMASDLPPLLADPTRLKQILLNLISNAIKFTPAGGQATVRADIEENGSFVLRATDTGIGIAADQIPALLKPFGQARESMTRDHEGAGLGLSLAKSLTELHGGTLELESEVGIGTTVTVRFPRERTIRRS